MKSSPDIIDRMDLVEASGIHLIHEWRVLEALARIGGSGNIEEIEKGSRLTLIAVSSTVLSMAGYTLRRFDPHPFLEIHGLDLQSLKQFSLPPDCRVDLTAKGWQAVQLMGYGRPALIVPDGSLYAAVVADATDPDAHLARMRHAHQLTQWDIQPAVSYHEA